MSRPERPGDMADERAHDAPTANDRGDGDGRREDDDDRDDPNEAAVRSLLKRALGPGTGSAPTPNLLPGVQRRIRVRSRGRFFGDGWSTGQARANYVLAGLVTVALALVAYLAMVPTATH